MEKDVHIALQEPQTPATDLERQIADMKKRWQELQQALIAPSGDTSTSSSPNQQQSSSAGASSASLNNTPPLVEEGKDQDYDEADSEHRQQPRGDIGEDDDGQEDDGDDIEEEDGDENGLREVDSVNKRKKGRNSGNGGGKRRRTSYSYNVDDRKAWRKRQVGIDGLTDEERWEQRMGELEAFKRRFGHVNVPQKWKENQKLANWLKNVRQRWTHVPNYLTPDKEQILNDLGVKKCEPLDVIIAKAKGRRGGGKRKRSTSEDLSDDGSDDARATDGAADTGDADTTTNTPSKSRSEDDEHEEAEVPMAKKRRRSAPEVRDMASDVKGEAGQEQQARWRADHEPRRGSEEAEALREFGLRRSARKRRPLFDLAHLDLVQRQQLHDHQGRDRSPASSMEASPLPTGSDE